MRNPTIAIAVTIIVLSELFGCEIKPFEIITCGVDQVFVIDFNESDTSKLKILWTWTANEVTDLPIVYQKYMQTTDDCKPVDDNKKILITSSGGGVVLVDWKTKQSLFYAHVPNAHSAEWLPQNRIAVVMSTSPGGNNIEIFDVDKPDVVLFRDSLNSGHGVVWITGRERLYALGYDELRAYSLKNWESEKPALQIEKIWQIPGKSGHDLIIASENRLILITADGVWNFDIPTEAFSPFFTLAFVRNIKSVFYDETTKRLIYIKAEKSWWTHHILQKSQ